MDRSGNIFDTRTRCSRRQVLALGASAIAGMVAAPAQLLAVSSEKGLKWLAEMTRMTERDTPLLTFRDYTADPDPEVERQIRSQLMQRPDILARLRKKFSPQDRLRLSIEDTAVRLMFVPQRQEYHTTAYQRYCTDIIDYFFDISRADNFYTTISAPRDSFPAIPETGVSAFLVHRLAKAYRAVCRLTAENGEHIRYRVSGAIFSNHLGAVDLEIEYVSPGRFALQRRPYTIWQNNTDTGYTLMAIPVEETLHYYLGNATDRQIAATLEKNQGKNLAWAKTLADEWMAVEESVVGGLVDQVMDGYFRAAGLSRPAQPPDVVGEQASSLAQYRYRQKGIALTRDLGLQQTVAMYMRRPEDFKNRLGLGMGA